MKQEYSTTRPTKAEDHQPQDEEIIAEEKAGFRAGKSTTDMTERIFNLQILCEKYLQNQQNLYHVFLWISRTVYIKANIIRVIENLYDKSWSGVLFKGITGDWFRTTAGVRQVFTLNNPLEHHPSKS